MANLNLSNYGIAQGRVVREPEIFKNSDGSHKVKLTVACKDEAGNGTQFISLDGFVNKDKDIDKSVYAYLKTGMPVRVAYSVRTNNYTDKTGKAVYSQVLSVNAVAIMESKAASDAREARKAAGTTAPEDEGIEAMQEFEG